MVLLTYKYSVDIMFWIEKFVEKTKDIKFENISFIR